MKRAKVRKPARKIDADTQQMLVDALDQVTRTLHATNELLNRLTNERERQAPRFDDFALRTGRAMAQAPADAEALAGDDEAVLRDLAGAHNLDVAMERLITLRNERYPNSHPRHWGIVNFDLHSAKPRMFVFDVVAQSVESYLCAHGIGSEGESDDGRADKFSNKSGSKASSLGIYRCAETYQSENNGYSLRLDGLEPTNDNARSRAVVVHGADYVSDAFADQHGRIGRSEGCPALDRQFSRAVIDQLKLGSLLIHWKTP